MTTKNQTDLNNKLIYRFKRLSQDDRFDITDSLPVIIDDLQLLHDNIGKFKIKQEAIIKKEFYHTIGICSIFRILYMYHNNNIPIDFYGFILYKFIGTFEYSYPIYHPLGNETAFHNPVINNFDYRTKYGKARRLLLADFIGILRTFNDSINSIKE